MNIDCQKNVKADRICAHYLFYKNQKEDQETSAALKKVQDSETEDVVAEHKSLSDSDTESEPDILLDDAVERRTSFGRTSRFPQKYMDFFASGIQMIFFFKFKLLLS